MKILNTLSVIIFSLSIVSPISGQNQELNHRLKDAHYSPDSFWIYNDIEKAKAAAKTFNKPLFVTFRCVPCKDCMGFDAEVAKGNQKIATLASSEFISVRIVEMKGINLSDFQFDYDLNWAGMFIHHDGTVLARYGTQSAEGADAYNSVAGLESTMKAVLKAYKSYPTNRRSFEKKKGSPQPYAKALELPGLNNKERYAGQTELNNCIHCHNIHDARHESLFRSKNLTHEKLWKFPLPKNVGLIMNRDTINEVQSVIPQSAAMKAGIKKGDMIESINEQSILSIADMQWVFHNASNNKESFDLRIRSKNGIKRVKLETSAGWKKSDISWRASMWNLPPRLGIWTPRANENELRKAGLQKDEEAILIKWINRKQNTSNAAWQAGLRQGDILLEVNGKPALKDPEKLHTYIKLNHQPGEWMTWTVLRNGKEKEIRFQLHR